MAPFPNMPVCEVIRLTSISQLELLFSGNCAFILPDLKPEHHHDFRVFTKNKYGDNFDRSYSIKVGRPRSKALSGLRSIPSVSFSFDLVESLVEKTRGYWPYMALFVIGACLASIALVCCSCRQLRKTMSQKRKTKANPESKCRDEGSRDQSSTDITSDLTYHNHNSHPSLIDGNVKIVSGKHRLSVKYL